MSLLDETRKNYTFQDTFDAFQKINSSKWISIEEKDYILSSLISATASILNVMEDDLRKQIELLSKKIDTISDIDEFKGLIDYTDRTFENIDFSNCIFSDINFTGSRFYNCKGNRVRFINCDFSGCSILHVYFAESFFDKADFSIHDGSANSNIDDVLFDNCKIHDSSFDYIKFAENISFLGCDFQNSSFYGVVMRKAVFDNSVFKKCNFENANMEGCSLKNCVYMGSFFVNANLKDTVRDNACFDEYFFDRCIM